MNEVWKDIEIEGYQISNLGRLKNTRTWFPGGKTHNPHWIDKEHILHPSINNSGYRIYQIRGKINTIHRLVAKAFIPNPDNLSDVDHINGDKLDNRVENLRWLNHKDNINAFNSRVYKKHKTVQVHKHIVYKVNRWIEVVETGEVIGTPKETANILNISIARLSQLYSNKEPICRGKYKGLHLAYKKERIKLYKLDTK